MSTNAKHVTTIRLTPEEHVTLQALAAADFSSQTAIIRKALALYARTHAEQTGMTPAANSYKPQLEEISLQLERLLKEEITFPEFNNLTKWPAFSLTMHRDVLPSGDLPEEEVRLFTALEGTYKAAMQKSIGATLTK